MRKNQFFYLFFPAGIYTLHGAICNLSRNGVVVTQVVWSIAASNLQCNLKKCYETSCRRVYTGQRRRNLCSNLSLHIFQIALQVTLQVTTCVTKTPLRDKLLRKLLRVFAPFIYYFFLHSLSILSLFFTPFLGSLSIRASSSPS